MRSLALLQLLALGISNLTLRLKLSAVPSPQKIETVDAFSLKTPVFLIYCASALCTFLGSTTSMFNLASERFGGHAELPFQ
jgi:hypothetical protein